MDSKASESGAVCGGGDNLHERCCQALRRAVGTHNATLEPKYGIILGDWWSTCLVQAQEAAQIADQLRLQCVAYAVPARIVITMIDNLQSLVEGQEAKRERSENLYRFQPVAGFEQKLSGLIKSLLQDDEPAPPSSLDNQNDQTLLWDLAGQATQVG